MNLPSIPLFQALVNRMKWLGARQNLLAQNVANSDTPRYRPQDLKPLGFKELVRDGQARLEPAATKPAHLPGAPNGAARHFPVGRRDEPYEVTPQGNGVTLEDQLMKVAKTRMDFELTSNLYRKHVDMFRIVLGRR